jgi:hypothetical protein
MSVFKIGPTNDLVREGGGFVRTEGTDEIRQGISTRLQIMRGEIPTDLSRGTPWLDLGAAPALLAKGVPPEIISARVRGRVASSPGVVEVLDLEIIDGGDRQISIPFTARISTDKLAADLLVQDTVTVAL